MSISKITMLLILSSSALAFAEPAADKPAQDNERKWTIHAASMYAQKGKAEKKPVVTDPGVWVTAQRDPQDKR